MPQRAADPFALLDAYHALSHEAETPHQMDVMSQSLRLLKRKSRVPGTSQNSSRPSTSGSSSSHSSAPPSSATPPSAASSKAGRLLLWSGSRSRTSPLVEPQLQKEFAAQECLRTAACRCETCMGAYRALEAAPDAGYPLTPEAATESDSWYAYDRPLSAAPRTRGVGTEAVPARPIKAGASIGERSELRCRLDTHFASAASASAIPMTSMPVTPNAAGADPRTPAPPSPPKPAPSSLLALAPAGATGWTPLPLQRSQLVETGRLPLRHMWLGGGDGAAPILTASPAAREAAHDARDEQDADDIAETVAWASDEDLDAEVLNLAHQPALLTLDSQSSPWSRSRSPQLLNVKPTEQAPDPAGHLPAGAIAPEALLDVPLVELRRRAKLAAELSQSGPSSETAPASPAVEAIDVTDAASESPVDWLPPGHRRRRWAATQPTHGASVASPALQPARMAYPTLPSLTTVSSLEALAPPTSITSRLPPLRPLRAILADQGAVEEAPSSDRSAPAPALVAALEPAPPVAPSSAPLRAHLEEPAHEQEQSVIGAGTPTTCTDPQPEAGSGLSGRGVRSPTRPEATPVPSPIRTEGASLLTPTDPAREARRRAAAERRLEAARKRDEVERYLREEREKVLATTSQHSSAGSFALPVSPPTPVAPSTSVQASRVQAEPARSLGDSTMSLALSDSRMSGSDDDDDGEDVHHEDASEAPKRELVTTPPPQRAHPVSVDCQTDPPPTVSVSLQTRMPGQNGAASQTDPFQFRSVSIQTPRPEQACATSQTDAPGMDPQQYRDHIIEVSLQMAQIIDDSIDAAVHTARVKVADQATQRARELAAANAITAQRERDPSLRASSALAAAAAAASAAKTAAAAEAAAKAGTEAAKPSPASPVPTSASIPAASPPTLASCPNLEGSERQPRKVSQQVAELTMRLQAARALQQHHRSTTPRRRRWQSAAIGALAAHRVRPAGRSPGKRPIPVPAVSAASDATWFASTNHAPSPSADEVILLGASKCQTTNPEAAAVQSNGRFRVEFPKGGAQPATPAAQSSAPAKQPPARLRVAARLRRTHHGWSRDPAAPEAPTTPKKEGVPKQLSTSTPPSVTWARLVEEAAANE